MMRPILNQPKLTLNQKMRTTPNQKRLKLDQLLEEAEGWKEEAEEAVELAEDRSKLKKVLGGKISLTDTPLL